VDQNIEILNQIAANSAKVEALHATILSILNEIPAGRSIGDDGNPRDLGLDNPPREAISDLTAMAPLNGREVLTLPEHDFTKSEDLSAVGSLRRIQVSEVETRASVVPCDLEPFSVPERSMARYDREQLYADVWSMPLRRAFRPVIPLSTMERNADLASSAF
jgi:hypothetical protein